MKNIFLALVFIFAAVGTVPAHATKKKGASLDGKTFVGTVAKVGDKKGNPDNFEFKNGRFHSTACDAYGFGDAPYTMSKANKEITFEAQTTNKSGAKMTWHGKIKSGKLEGKAVMASKDGSPPDNYTFQGTIKK